VVGVGVGVRVSVSVRCREFIIRINSKFCREFIIMINSDVFNLRIYYNSKFKGGAHADIYIIDIYIL
jgi:hypothetical protein